MDKHKSGIAHRLPTALSAVCYLVDLGCGKSPQLV
jgi:hypothetical protein